MAHPLAAHRSESLAHGVRRASKPRSLYAATGMAWLNGASLVDARTLEDLEEAREPLVIGRSARVGEVRLVDNLVLGVDFHPAPAGERRPVRKAEFWPKPTKRKD